MSDHSPPRDASGEMSRRGRYLVLSAAFLGWFLYGFSGRIARLEASGRYRVIMTRASDVFIPLDDRVKIARDAGAALFISIHADTIGYEPGVSGATVYTGAEKASDRQAARLAENENRADVIAGMFVLAEDQYGVGDEVDLGIASGTVERISLRAVRIRDGVGGVWFVPHGGVARVGNLSKSPAAVLDLVVARYPAARRRQSQGAREACRMRS